MRLNGKAKQDFETWVVKNYGFDTTMIHRLSGVLLNALIIEWFDSVGFYLTILPCIDKTFDSYITFKEIRKEVCQFQKTRQEAIIQAILTANKLYNETNKI